MRMNNKLYRQKFECIIQIFETIISHRYLLLPSYSLVAIYTECPKI